LLAVVLQGQCDASLLLKKNKDLTIAPEINATTNQGIRGLDFIDYLKTRVVAACVGKKDLVSYADIIALATRDAVALVSMQPFSDSTSKSDVPYSMW
jgi:hypothetical protein